jgi:hypothetical protein
LLRVAQSCTVVALERHVRALRSAPSADPEIAEAGEERRGVAWAFNEDGTLSFWGRLGAVDGTAFIEGIETAAERIHGSQDCLGERRRPSLRHRRADALGEIMRSGCPQTTLMLHADLDALANDAGHKLHLRDGPSIPPGLARRLTCDAMITVKGLNHGKSIRLSTKRQRDAIEERDGRTCWIPGCDQTHGLEAHHLKHWTQGGRTDIDELILLCHYHHHRHHEGGWKLELRGDRILIRNRNGNVVDEQPRPPRLRQRARKVRINGPPSNFGDPVALIV